MTRTPYLTIADIAKIYGIKPRTIRGWASHDRWRHTSGRPVRYHLGDAQATYERLRVNRARHHLTMRYGSP